MTERVDVAVIGLGAMGSAAAAMLSSRVSRLDVRAPMEVAVKAVTILVSCAGTVADCELGRHDVLTARGLESLELRPRGSQATGVLITGLSL